MLIFIGLIYYGNGYLTPFKNLKNYEYNEINVVTNGSDIAFSEFGRITLSTNSNLSINLSKIYSTNHAI